MKAYSIVATALLAVVAQSSLAQTTTAAPREAVKAETKAAASSGSLIRPGEAPDATASREHRRSTKTRAQRKSETAMERRMGGLMPAGQGDVIEDHMNRPRRQMKSRPEVKQETKAAAQSGALTPAGEATQRSK